MSVGLCVVGQAVYSRPAYVQSVGLCSVDGLCVFGCVVCGGSGYV